VVGSHVTVSTGIDTTSAAIDTTSQRSALRALRYLSRAINSRPASS